MTIFPKKCESPAQSPDLNPLEMVWADMKAFVASRFCRKLDEVKDTIFEYKKKVMAQGWPGPARAVFKKPGRYRLART